MTVSLRLVRISVGLLLGGTVWGHDPAAEFETDVVTEAKPWTHLDFQNDPDDFQFAVITDRTGSPRDGVWEDAIKKLNWMRPEFVLSVGDLIQGSSENAATNAAEWDDMMDMLAPLKMPFFFAAGNHDIQMKWVEGRVQPEEMLAEWNARFGTTHYSFVYKNVLFVALFTNDGKEQYISEEQANYFKGALAAHPEVRWTFVFLHHPLWDYSHESNFNLIDDALQADGRRHTVLAGHRHRYIHFDRNNEDYIVLASTGGGSQMRGSAFGEFDHFAWFTMTDEGPVMANLDLAGIYPKDVSKMETVTMVRELQQSTDISSSVVLDQDADGMVRAAAAFLTLRNHASHPLRIIAKFSHSHHVLPSTGEIIRELPPGGSEVVEVGFRVLEPFAAADGLAVNLQAEMQLIGVANDELRQTISKQVFLTEDESEVFRMESMEFVGSTEIDRLAPGDDRIIRYTTDGSDPKADSPQLNEPITITTPTALRARIFTRDGIMGPIDRIDFTPRSPGSGLWARYFEYDRAKGKISFMPNLEHMEPDYVRHVDGFDVAAVARVEENFVIVFHGWLEIEEAGNYGFHVENEDGARLLINTEVVVDDMILHPRRETSGFVRLEVGRHPIELQFCQTNRGYYLGVEFTGPDGIRRPIPVEALSVDAAAAPSWLAEN